MEQLQLVTVGYSSSGGERVNENWTPPQWQLPVWELRLVVGVGGNVMVFVLAWFVTEGVYVCMYVVLRGNATLNFY